jgi:polysaccharide deacetylase 2 family uncharacterized protein YibQ
VALAALILVVWVVVASRRPVEIASISVTLPPPPKTAEPGPGVGLPPAPVPELVQESPAGRLPRIGADGRTPWQVYARPFDRSDDRPRVAIVVSNEGDLDNSSMAEALRLPGAVTLAFSPYTKGSAAEWLAKARASGHEVLLGVPMESAESAPGDPGGPLTLRADLDDASNQQKLEQILAKAVGYVGILPLAAGRLMSAPERLLPILEILKQRGLLFVDTGAQGQSAAAALPKVKVSRPGEGHFTRDTVDRRLADLEEDARRSGAALGVLPATPVTIERLAAWIPALDGRRIALAPVSALVPR